MTRYELNKEYFEWLCDKVYDDKHFKTNSYFKLLNLLHLTDFTYTLLMDGNRFEDGVDLRYRFGNERNYEPPMIASYLDDKPCSILEMLVALSLRCEEHIMDNPEIGDRTSVLFWIMIDNLGLGRMNDTKYNESKANDILIRFLNREYEPDGKGGLITIPNIRYDMRTIEIWYQVMWFLNDFLKDD